MDDYFVPPTASATSPYAQQYLESEDLPSHSDGWGARQDRLAVEVGRLLDDVRRALKSDIVGATATAARLAAFLASKSSEPAHSRIRGGLAPWQKRKVERFIDEGLEAALPIDDLAELVSLSPSYFCRAFKESFGEPPHAYVVKRRVERAKTLMLRSSESLSQIALASGMADQAHLCRCFRKSQARRRAPGAAAAQRNPDSTVPRAWKPNVFPSDVRGGRVRQPRVRLRCGRALRLPADRSARNHDRRGVAVAVAPKTISQRLSVIYEIVW